MGNRSMRKSLGSRRVIGVHGVVEKATPAPDPLWDLMSALAISGCFSRIKGRQSAQLAEHADSDVRTAFDRGMKTPRRRVPRMGDASRALIRSQAGPWRRIGVVHEPTVFLHTLQFPGFPRHLVAQIASNRAQMPVWPPP